MYVPESCELNREVRMDGCARSALQRWKTHI